MPRFSIPCQQAAGTNVLNRRRAAEPWPILNMQDRASEGQAGLGAPFFRSFLGGKKGLSRKTAVMLLFLQLEDKRVLPLLFFFNCDRCHFHGAFK